MMDSNITAAGGSSSSSNNNNNNNNNIRHPSSNFRRPPIRQPLSCAPCRKAKIKCDRRQPCASCRRRNCEESCGYRVEADHEAGTERDREGEPAEGCFDMASRARLQYLESLLRQGRLLENCESSPDSSSATHILTRSDYSVLGTTSSQTSATDFTAMSIPNGGQSVTEESSSTSSSIEPTLSAFAIRSSGEVSFDESVASYMKQINGSDQSSSLLGADATVGFPFASDGLNNFEALLMLLPPRKTCDYLVSCYFTVFSPLFHILHSPTFFAEYHAFSKNPHSVGSSWLSVLFVVLALSVTCLEDHDPVLADMGREASPYKNVAVLASRYRDATMKSLMASQFLVHYNMNSLQALILLIYSLNHSHGSGQSWSLLGIVLHTSIALNLHIDGRETKFSVLEVEQRRRCWAGLLMLYTVQATAFGITDTMRLDVHQVSLPADVNDADIHPDRIDAASRRPTEMTYMLFKFRLYKLSSDICKKVFAPTKPSPDVLAGLVKAINAEESTWDNQYLLDGEPNLFQYRDQAHWNILHGYANQLYLLIYRPFVSSDHSISSQYPEAHRRCIDASLAILNLHKEFCTSPGFRQYRWFTCGLCSFFALHGAVTLAVLMISIMDEWREENFSDIPRCRAAFDELIDRFGNLQQQSLICAKALPILTHLQSFLVSRELYIPQTVAPNPWMGRKEQSSNIEDGLAFGDLFQEWSQPNHWTGPSAINWKIWDTTFSTTQC